MVPSTITERLCLRQSATTERYDVGSMFVSTAIHEVMANTRLRQCTLSVQKNEFVLSKALRYRQHRLSCHHLGCRSCKPFLLSPSPQSPRSGHSLSTCCL